MKSYRLLFGSAVVSLIVLIACGAAASPSELLIGTWNSEDMEETIIVEFRSDGTVQPEDEELQRYVIIEGEPATVKIMGLDSDFVYAELELVFNGDDQCTLSGEGRTMTLNRVE